MSATRIAVVSLGCPKNLVDTEKMLGLLAQDGCLVGASPDDADVILINTCAFIAPARRESTDAIADALARKAAGQVRRVVVAGCLPQKQAKELRAAYPGIDAIIGVFNRDDVVRAVRGEGPMMAVGRASRGPCFDDTARLRLTPRHLAYLRIAEGCNSGCSYCTIPSIRGPLRSKPPDAVVAEAAELLADGAIELDLIAQDTTAYGHDLGGPCLADILQRLGELPGLQWLRLMYAHPASLAERTIAAMAACGPLVPYLDLPLQHINDRILASMRRRYTRRHVEGQLDALRAAIPGIAIRTTFIVGFPGETRAEFDELAGFVREQRFAAVGVFPYHPEPGTAAARLADQLPARTRQRRRDRLMAIQQEIALAANTARVGTELDVLVDGPDAAGRLVGRHQGQAPDVDGVCRFTGRATVGRIVRATVTGSDGYDLIVRAKRPGSRP